MRMRVVCLAMTLLGSACTSVSVPWHNLVVRADASSRSLWTESRVLGTQEKAEPGLQTVAESGPELEAEEPAEEEAEPLNAFVLFLGATHRDETDPSFALTYVRRLNPGVALGITLERTPSVRESVLLLPELMLYPVSRLYVVLSPGLEFEPGGPLFLFRVGTGWDFELGNNWALAPEFNYDFVSGAKNAVVAGIGLAYSF